LARTEQTAVARRRRWSNIDKFLEINTVRELADVFLLRHLPPSREALDRPLKNQSGPNGAIRPHLFKYSPK
jgi:hypothetical protein